MADSTVWLITGCSTGFGRELARAVLAGVGDGVTARDTGSLRELKPSRDGADRRAGRNVPSQVEAVVGRARAGSAGSMCW